MKQTIGSKFRKRYGAIPRNRHVRTMHEMLFDAYVSGHIDGYDASNKMWQKKGKK